MKAEVRKKSHEVRGMVLPTVEEMDRKDRNVLREARIAEGWPHRCASRKVVGWWGQVASQESQMWTWTRRKAWHHAPWPFWRGPSWPPSSVDRNDSRDIVVDV